MYFVNFNITEDPNWEGYAVPDVEEVAPVDKTRKFKHHFKIDKITTFGEVFISFDKP